MDDANYSANDAQKPMKRTAVYVPQTAKHCVKRGGRTDCQIILTLATIKMAARTDFTGI
jgi:hypothetical protein